MERKLTKDRLDILSYFTTGIIMGICYICAIIFPHYIPQLLLLCAISTVILLGTNLKDIKEYFTTFSRLILTLMYGYSISHIWLALNMEWIPSPDDSTEQLLWLIGIGMMVVSMITDYGFSKQPKSCTSNLLFS